MVIMISCAAVAMARTSLFFPNLATAKLKRILMMRTMLHELVHLQENQEKPLDVV